MPSTVLFGDKTNGTYQIKDSIRYAYDKMGNIEKVYEMARALLPAILEFYSVEENRQAFEKWKAEQNDSLKQIEKK